MRIALVQLGSPDGETPSARLDRVESTLLSIPSADLVVLPELWVPGYFNFDRYEQSADELDRSVRERYREWARSGGWLLHAGSAVERDADGKLHNSSVLLDSDGEILATYRKIHVFGFQSREAELINPGEEISVVRTPFGRIGLSTCYDLRFPEFWRLLVDAGAELVICTAAWPIERLEHWRLFTSARAVEDQIFTIACNATGEHQGVRLAGHSRVVGPDGSVIAESDDQEGVTLLDIDPNHVQSVRARFPVLQDRRLGRAHHD